MKLSDIIAKYDAMTAVGGKDGLSFDTKYVIAQNLNILETSVRVFREKRAEIAIKYAEKDAEGKVVEKNGEVTLTDRSAFLNEISKLLDEDVDIFAKDLHSIKKTDLEAANANVAEIRSLMDMIEEEDTLCH